VMSRMPPTVVSDATCIIALHRIGRLEILERLYRKIYIPPAVRKEVTIGDEDWILVEPVRKPEIVQGLRTILDEGESEAIALALENPGALLITDDRKARKIATEFGLKITGTIGVLLHGWRAGIVQDPEQEIEQLSKTGFHMTPELKREAIRLMREQPK
jgi:predicted nucleic acid-binding protein